MRFLKKMLLWSVLGGILYLLLSYHFILIGGTNLRLLKKSELTLEQTIYSTHGKKLEKIMAVDSLREDGISEILIEEGLMTEAEERMIMSRYED